MNKNASSDEELALQIQRGNNEALTLLVEHYHGPILGFLYRMTDGDRPLAEDLVQETFLRALSAIGQYAYPRPFKPWLYTIALNLVRDHFKKAEIRQVEAMPEGFDPASADSPDDRLLATEEAKRVAAAVSGLPVRQREAVILRYYQRLALAEIAEMLHIPVGTVKSRISLGLKRLKDCLKELDDRR